MRRPPTKKMIDLLAKIDRAGALGLPAIDDWRTYRGLEQRGWAKTSSGAAVVTKEGKGVLRASKIG